MNCYAVLCLNISQLGTWTYNNIFYFCRTKSVAADIEHIVHSTRDLVVTFMRSMGSITSEIVTCKQTNSSKKVFLISYLSKSTCHYQWHVLSNETMTRQSGPNWPPSFRFICHVEVSKDQIHCLLDFLGTKLNCWCRPVNQAYFVFL